MAHLLRVSSLTLVGVALGLSASVHVHRDVRMPAAAAGTASSEEVDTLNMCRLG